MSTRTWSGSGSPDANEGDGSSTPSSFVFTSSKIAQSYRNTAESQEDALATVLSRSRSQSMSSGPTPALPVLTAVQVTTHAYGASHALPAHSSFRRDKKDARPFPIRSISEIPTPHRTANPQQKPQASKTFYLELIGRFSATMPSKDSSQHKRSPDWSPISEPAPATKTDAFLPHVPMTASSKPSSLHNDNPPKQKFESSYFTFEPCQATGSHHR